MGGLGVLLVVGLYLFVAYKVVNSAQTRKGRWLLVALMTLIPTADAIVGRLYLHHLCSTEGGLKVNRVVNDVDGFITDSAATDEWIKGHGYQFTEGNPVNGLVRRFSWRNGSVVREDALRNEMTWISCSVSV